MFPNAISACPLRSHIDPRLIRFTAGATTVVLGTALLLVPVARPVAMGLLAAQVAVFAFTGFVNFQWSVWARIYAWFIWPRIEAPRELLDARPTRFAQGVGFVLTGLALVFFVLGLDMAGYVLTALALAGAALNACTGVCLSCRLYQAVRKH